MEKWGEMASTLEPQNSVINPYNESAYLYTLAKAADSSAECKLYRVGLQGVQKVEPLHSLRLMP